MGIQYRWECVHDWLGDKASDKSDVLELRNLINHMASVMDHDTLEDLFREELTEDRFYTPLTKEEADRLADQRKKKNDETKQEHPLKSTWSWMATIHLAIAADSLPTEGHVVDWVSGLFSEVIPATTGDLLGWGYAKIGAQWQYPTRQLISFDEYGELRY